MKFTKLLLLLILFMALSASTAKGQEKVFAVKDKILYVGADNFLMVYDCTDPAKAKFIQSLTFPDKVYSVTIRDSSLFVSVNKTGLFLFNIPELKSQTIKAKILSQNSSFIFDGKTIYEFKDSTIKRISITAAQNFEVKDSATVAWGSYDKIIKNNRVYILKDAVYILDISDFSNIKLLSTTSTGFTFTPAAVVSNYLYFGHLVSTGPRSTTYFGVIYEISDSSALTYKYNAPQLISLETTKNDLIYGISRYSTGYNGTNVMGLDVINPKTGESQSRQDIDQHAFSLRLSEDESTIYVYSGNSPYSGGALGQSIAIYSLTPPLTLQLLGGFSIYLPVGVKEEGAALKSYSLSQNYPNPFNMETNISYTLPVDNFVSLKVLDITGREVATLVNENISAGTHTVHFDAKGLSSGIYFYRITAGGFSQIKKLILLK